MGPTPSSFYASDKATEYLYPRIVRVSLGLNFQPVGHLRLAECQVRAASPLAVGLGSYKALKINALHSPIHYTLCNMHYTLHTICYTIHYILYIINYAIHYTLYTIHYTLYT